MLILYNKLLITVLCRYGDDTNEEKIVRYKYGDPEYGLGLLKPDLFVDDRMLSLPPSSAVILVLFNRNHNVCTRRIHASILSTR